MVRGWGTWYQDVGPACGPLGDSHGHASSGSKTHPKAHVVPTGENPSRGAGAVPELSWPLPPGLPLSALAAGNWGALAHLQVLLCAREPHTHLLQSRAGICWEPLGGSCLIVTPRLHVQKWQLAGASIALGASDTVTE